MRWPWPVALLGHQISTAVLEGAEGGLEGAWGSGVAETVAPRQPGRQVEMLVAMPQEQLHEDLAQGQQQAEQGLLEGQDAACRLIGQAEVE
jgi:hypothetical protein